MSKLHEQFDKAVQEYIEKVSKKSGVIGVVLTGSAGRSDFDKYSDIDNVVITEGFTDAKDGKTTIRDFLIDTRLVTLQDLNGKWSDDMYFAYLKSTSVYDPEERIKDLFLKKKKEWEAMVPKRLALELVDIGFIYEFKNDWRHLQCITNYQKFMQRKDYVSTQRLLTQGFETVLGILFLLNYEPLPDSKNRMKLLKELKLVPNEAEEELRNGFLLEEYTENDIKRRYKILESLVKKVVSVAEKEFVLPKNLDEYYFAERE